MISNKDRSGYIGASDTCFVMRKWDTPTFARWWRIKQGIQTCSLQTDAMKAGSAYEHRILDHLAIPNLEKDKQVIKGLLRVNFDGTTPEMVHEVKTHSALKKFVVTKEYWMQVQVEMYALGVTRAEIIAYGLEKEDYDNYYREIDNNRITRHEISFDKDFIDEYLHRALYLFSCLKTEKFPNEKEVDEWHLKSPSEMQNWKPGS